ncbi:histidine phosphatase family protein [Subtercola sp. PAMC28395]|uniref:histidine phosphatase family protein n=1 Tax=Subtercola sp. PAMC28395 TaxID=2846775 RepID=UPI001C0C5C82|nr:histidine phosphatase family protein [Subtercola sp. PAMC28395]QWT24365.1 histidine phosphatase family protein [Subtercola sp. PAMC28395]
MRLLLIRHGQTIDNVNGALGTAIPGPGLTPLGKRQAAAIPDSLASIPVDAIYVSTLRRTHETAAPLALARGIQPVVLEGIHEIDAGDLEQRSDEEAIRSYMGTIFSWWGDFDARIPGGEDGNEFYGRYTAAIEQVAAAHPTGTVAVVSHGAAIRTWASYASQNIDAEFSKTHVLENTAVVVLEGSAADGWVTTYWADEPIGGAGLEDHSAPDPTAGGNGAES